jgi:tetratricopeptide (TPR) repeat protein
MNMNLKLKLSAFCAILMVVTFNSMAQQTKNDAITAYNAGRSLMQSNAQAAIDSFEFSMKICDQVGDSAQDVKKNIVLVLPGLYYQVAYKLFTADKKVPESLIAAKKAMKVAEKYENAKAKDNVQKLILSAYFSLGNNYFKNNELDNAIKSFDSALAINPNYTKAIFNKAQVYKKQDNSTLFMATIDDFVAKAKASGDTAQIAPANKLAMDYLRSSGSKAIKANKLDDALSLLTSATKYGTDKEIYYYFADAYNKKGKFTEAEENAQKGLDMETGAPEAKAKFYYALAEAKKGKGDVGNACAAFKNAMFGIFLEPSKAQMANLKCK